jgi:nicotinic acid mononucleotide adenylyltransferase
MDDTLATAITAIHAVPQQLVFEFAGAGAQALAWLHAVGGSAKTVLEATDRYATASLITTIGFEPLQFTTLEVARALALKAYLRAVELTPPDTPVMGVGCTATIATSRPKQGDHRCCVVLYDAQGVAAYSLMLMKGARTRREEEDLVSLLVLGAIADRCQVKGMPPLILRATELLQEQLETHDLPTRLLAGDFNLLTITPQGVQRPGQTLPDVTLLSGSFNPLHEGHRRLAEVAAQKSKQPLYFELPLINADKAPLQQEEALRRAAQFETFAPVVLTCAPLFSQKAKLFPQATFVVGADTAIRLVSPRFYGNDLAQVEAALEVVRRAGCRFLVAGRQQEDTFLTLRDVQLPPGYRDLFQELPPQEFRLDISSTAIRTATYKPSYSR